MEATTSNNAFKAQVAARLAELGYDIETFSSEKESHAADYRDGNPSVYCGTYGKYNDGEMSDVIPTDEDLQRGFATIPSFPGNE